MSRRVLGAAALVLLLLFLFGGRGFCGSVFSDPDLELLPGTGTPPTWVWEWSTTSTTPLAGWYPGTEDVAWHFVVKDVGKYQGAYSQYVGSFDVGGVYYISVWMQYLGAQCSFRVGLEWENGDNIWAYYVKSTDTWQRFASTGSLSSEVVQVGSEVVERDGVAWKAYLVKFRVDGRSGYYPMRVHVRGYDDSGVDIDLDAWVTKLEVFDSDPSASWPVPPAWVAPWDGQWWDPGVWANGIPPALSPSDPASLRRVDQVVSDPGLGDSYQDGVTWSEKRPLRLWVRGGAAGYKWADVVVNGKVVRYKLGLPSDPLQWMLVEIQPDEFSWREWNHVGVHLYGDAGGPADQWWDLRWFYEPPSATVSVMGPATGTVDRDGNVQVIGAFRNASEGATYWYRVDGGAWQQVPGGGPMFDFSIPGLASGEHTIDFGVDEGTGIRLLDTTKVIVDLDDAVPEPPGPAPEAPGDIPLTGLGVFLKWLDVAKGFLTECFLRFPGEFSTLMLVGLGVSIILRVLNR